MLRRDLIGTVFLGAALLGAAGAVKAAPATGQHEDIKGPWEVIFDGTSTGQLRGYKQEGFPAQAWSVTDGTLTTNPQATPVDLVTKGEYTDFDLQLEWRVTPGANSGVMYHAGENAAEAWNTGPEIQVLDDARHADGQHPKTSAGALYALVAPDENKVLNPVGEWNQFRLLVIGPRVRHWLNGRKLLDIRTDSPKLKELIARSKFAEFPGFNHLETGHIVLQHHQDQVSYRNVRVRRIQAPKD